MTIQLIHPAHGICAQENISPYKTVDRITKQWTSKYGDKFYECEIMVVSDPVNKKTLERPAAIYGNAPHSHG